MVMKWSTKYEGLMTYFEPIMKKKSILRLMIANFDPNVQLPNIISCVLAKCVSKLVTLGVEWRDMANRKDSSYEQSW